MFVITTVFIQLPLAISATIDAEPQTHTAATINKQAFQIFQSRIDRLTAQALTTQNLVYSSLIEIGHFKGASSISQFELQKIINSDPGQIVSYLVGLDSYALWQSDHGNKSRELDNVAHEISEVIEHLNNLDRTDAHLRGMNFSKINDFVQKFEVLKAQTQDAAIVLRNF
jgi:hypothetical protein